MLTNAPIDAEREQAMIAAQKRYQDQLERCPLLSKFVPENYDLIYDQLLVKRRTFSQPIPLSSVVSKVVVAMPCLSLHSSMSHVRIARLKSLSTAGNAMGCGKQLLLPRPHHQPQAPPGPPPHK
jgi:hypothetical protein